MSPSVKFSLLQIIRLAGGPAKIVKAASVKKIELNKWAPYKWGAEVGVNPVYHPLLAELTGLDVDVIAKANDQFNESRNEQKKVSAT